jgi:hypothetical protein
MFCASAGSSTTDATSRKLGAISRPDSPGGRRPILALRLGRGAYRRDAHLLSAAAPAPKAARAPERRDQASPTWCGSFPNAQSCLRLIRALAVEMNENWLEAHRSPGGSDKGSSFDRVPRSCWRSARRPRSIAARGHGIDKACPATRHWRPAEMIMRRCYDVLVTAAG